MAFWKKPTTKDPVTATPSPTLNDTTKAAKAIEAGIPTVVSGLASASDSLSSDPLVSRFGKIRSALGEGTVIQGKLSFDTPVRIDGKLGGQVYSTNAVIVGPKGSIEADIDVTVLVVMGHVNGNIFASERIEILAGGSVEGKVNCPVLVLAEGGLLDAECSRPKSSAQVVTEKSVVDEQEAEHFEGAATEVRVH